MSWIIKITRLGTSTNWTRGNILHDAQEHEQNPKDTEEPYKTPAARHSIEQTCNIYTEEVIDDDPTGVSLVEATDNNLEGVTANDMTGVTVEKEGGIKYKWTVSQEKQPEKHQQTINLETETPSYTKLTEEGRSDKWQRDRTMVTDIPQQYLWLSGNSGDTS